MTGYAVIFMGRAGGITGAAPSLQDLTAALTYVEEDREPGAEEVRFNSRNESSSLETHFSYQRACILSPSEPRHSHTNRRNARLQRSPWKGN